jgi:hypothetical protein
MVGMRLFYRCYLLAKTATFHFIIQLSFEFERLFNDQVFKIGSNSYEIIIIQNFCRIS